MGKDKGILELDVLNVYNFKGNKLLLTLVDKEGNKITKVEEQFRPYFYKVKPYVNLLGLRLNKVKFRNKLTGESWAYAVVDGVKVIPNLEYEVVLWLKKDLVNELNNRFRELLADDEFREYVKQLVFRYYPQPQGLIYRFIGNEKREWKFIPVLCDYVFGYGEWVNAQPHQQQGVCYFPYDNLLIRLLVLLIWYEHPTVCPFAVHEFRELHKAYPNQLVEMSNRLYLLWNELIREKKEIRELFSQLYKEYVVSSLKLKNENVEIVDLEVGGILPISKLLKDKSAVFSKLIFLEKVSVKHPSEVRTEREKYPITYEADILYDFRYLLDYYIGIWEQVGDTPNIVPKKVLYFDIEVFRNFKLTPPTYRKNDNYINSISLLLDYKGNQEMVLILNVEGLNNAQLRELRKQLRHYSVYKEDDFYLVKHPQLQDFKFKVHLVKSEKDLLSKFIKYLELWQPHILTGWNILGFDIPYILGTLQYKYPQLYSRFLRLWLKVGDTPQIELKPISKKVISLYAGFEVGGSSILKTTEYIDDDTDFIIQLEQDFYTYVIRTILFNLEVYSQFVKGNGNKVRLWDIKQKLNEFGVGWIIPRKVENMEIEEGSFLYYILELIYYQNQLRVIVNAQPPNERLKNVVIGKITEIEEKLNEDEGWGLFLQSLYQDYISKEEVERELVNVELPTAVLIDYYRLYKMEKTPKPESYTLDYIAQLETGYSKEEYEGSLDELYTQNPFKFVLYNIVDSWLVYQIDRKTGYLTIIDQLKSESSLPLRYFNSQYRTKLGDGLIIREIRQRKIKYAVITKPQFTKDKYEGAFVFIPKAGMYLYVIDLDASSLYPSTNMTYQISHENFMFQVGGKDISIYDLYILHKLVRYYAQPQNFSIQKLKQLVEKPFIEVVKEIGLKFTEAVDYLRDIAGIDVNKPFVEYLNQRKCWLGVHKNFQVEKIETNLRNVLNILALYVVPLVGRNFTYTPNGAFWKRFEEEWFNENKIQNAPIFPAMLYVAVKDRKKYKKIRDTFGIMENILKQLLG